MIATNDAQMQIFNISSDKFEVLRNLNGHVGDILNCKFYPSGQVVLSCGSDYQLKIWNLLDGSCAASLKGHAGNAHPRKCHAKNKNKPTSQEACWTAQWLKEAEM